MLGESVQMSVMVQTPEGWSLPDELLFPLENDLLLEGLPDGAYRVSAPFFSTLLTTNATINGGTTAVVHFVLE